MNLFLYIYFIFFLFEQEKVERFVFEQRKVLLD